MQISDLFDAHRRDEAVRTLSDEDLLVATVMITSERPTDSLQRDWLALDIAWFAIHVDAPATAAAIFRRAHTVLTGSVLIEGLARVLHHREAHDDDPWARRDRVDRHAARIAHVANHAHGPAILAEIARCEAERMLEGTSDRALQPSLRHLVAWIDSPELLERLLCCDRLHEQADVVARLWDLGEHAIVRAVATDDHAGPAVWSARHAARRLLPAAGV